MRHLTLLVAVLAIGMPARADVDKTAINNAIDRGVLALKKAQNHDGTWHSSELGATSLAALTLLECGVAKDDPAVKAAAAHVRKAGLTDNKTYSLACSILFLDKLDAAADTPLIE